MPELPEVETMVAGIRPFIEGRRILEVKKCRCRCKPISITPRFSQLTRRIGGQHVDRVRRLGKRVVLDLAGGDSLVIEPRMTGLLLLADPPDPEHLRMEWCFSGKRKHNSLWFWDRRGLGTVKLYSQTELHQELGPDKLGPDALEMSVGEWTKRLGKTARDIKVALLDQKLTAGIGNLYASEILHLAGVHPAHRANTLKPKQIRKLHSAVQGVLRQAIQLEGSTLSDATYRNALNQVGRYQNSHRVYNRADQPCTTCGKSTVQRIIQAQRSTFYCPKCQRLGNQSSNS